MVHPRPVVIQPPTFRRRGGGFGIDSPGRKQIRIADELAGQCFFRAVAVIDLGIAESVVAVLLDDSSADI